MSIDAIIVKFPTTISGAILVIAGMYGNGEERKTALKKDGFDVDAVQKAVNDLLPIFNKYKE
jgi:hypothetical protein|nr:MAG TPA_asm: Cpl-7 lysozyme C-terminal domain [Caudoviricetes sp.]